MEINQEKIEAAIVDQAVHKLIGDDDLYDRVRRGVDDRINKLFAERVDTLIADAVAKIVREGFDRTYQKTDSFGRPRGEPTSISKELESLVAGYWTQRVDRNGKKTDDTYSGTTTRAEWMMMQICSDQFSAELKQHTVNVAGALKDHFRSVLNDHIAVMLSDVFHVKSQGDQARAAANKATGSAVIKPDAKPIGA